jgi:hypothetical protein
MSKTAGKRMYRPAIARLLGASLGAGFSTRFSPQKTSSAPASGCTTPSCDVFSAGHLFHRDHATGAFGNEYVRHLAHRHRTHAVLVHVLNNPASVGQALSFPFSGG